MLEQYVIVPLETMTKMEEKLKEKDRVDPIGNDPVQVLESNQEDRHSVEEESGGNDIGDEESDTAEETGELKETPLKTQTKKLANSKKFYEVRFNKFLKALEEYDIGALKLPNLSTLVKYALSPSAKRPVPNEERFVNFLIQHNLTFLMKNHRLIATYLPNWFRV